MAGSRNVPLTALVLVDECCFCTPRITIHRCVASITGFAAGLLGIGGGIIAVPLLQRMAHLPLRTAIATSSALMCLTATIGAARKNFTLPEITDAGPWDGVIIAAVLAPTAILGGYVGAHLTHVLPLRLLRIVFVLLLAVACFRFLT